MTDKTITMKDAVLVVEDTAANHDVIRAFLGDINVRCESVFDGMGAITACSSTEKDFYSLILMDINLPHMNGFETAGKLRRMGIETPIIAVTAFAEDELKARQADKVFDAILHKPFNSTEFFAAIAPYIKNASVCALNGKPAVKDREDRPLIDRQVCDVSRGIANMGNNPRLFTKHFNNFKRNNADLVIRMKTLISSQKYEECALLCHSIKGLSGMLGLTSLYENIIRLESLLQRVNSDSCAKDSVEELLSSISSDIRLVCQLQL